MNYRGSLAEPIPALGSRQPSHVHNQRWHGTPLPSSSPSEVAWRPWSLWAAVGSSNECCIVTVPWSAPAVEWDLQTKRIHIAWKRNFKDAATLCAWSAAISKHLLFWRGHKKKEKTKSRMQVFFSAEKGSYACLPNPQSIDPPTHAWQANRLLQTYQENLTPTQHIALFYTRSTKWKEPRSAPAYRNFQSHRSLPNVDPLASSMIPYSTME